MFVSVLLELIDNSSTKFMNGCVLLYNNFLLLPFCDGNNYVVLTFIKQLKEVPLISNIAEDAA